MKGLGALLLSLFLLSSGPVGGQGLIDTVGGGGPNRVPALDAPLLLPTGVVHAPDGTVFVIVERWHRVFKIDSSGLLTVVAGNGTPGFSGDGGPAVDATLQFPLNATLDSSGNLYIADRVNNRIRKVDRDGVITTVAGGGRFLPGDGGPATLAVLRSPEGVAMDNVGNLYIADRANFRVRKVDPSGTITTVAGNGVRRFGGYGDGGPATSASLDTPTNVSIDASGQILIADRDRVRRVDTSGIIATVAGGNFSGPAGDGGPATDAVLNAFDVAADGSGGFYVVERFGHRIRRVDASGIISTVAGTGTRGFGGDHGPAISASLAFPSSVAVEGEGVFWIADSSNNRIRQVDALGIIATRAGNGTFGFGGDGGSATDASLRVPSGVAVNHDGSIVVSDRGNQRVRSISISGTIQTIAGNGGCCFSGDGVPATQARIGGPLGVSVDRDGNLLIPELSGHRVRKVDTNGIITTIAGNGVRGFGGDGGLATYASLNSPFDVVADPSGRIFIADSGNHRVRIVDASGNISTVAGTGKRGFSGDGGPATNADFSSPTSVALDADGNLFISDRGNNRIRMVTAAGLVTTVAGGGGCCGLGDEGPATNARLAFPVGIAVTANGVIFIADTNHNRIRRVDSSGTITTVAGNGFVGFSGDGGLSTTASLAFPYDVAADRQGTIFVADLNNRRIRRVRFDPEVLLDSVIEHVLELNLQQGIENSLDSKLDAAHNTLDDLNENNDVAAINSLEAFINAVEAQRGNRIDEDDADALILAVHSIIDLLTAS